MLLGIVGVLLALLTLSLWYAVSPAAMPVPFAIPLTPTATEESP